MLRMLGGCGTDVDIIAADRERGVNYLIPQSDSGIRTRRCELVRAGLVVDFGGARQARVRPQRDRLAGGELMPSGIYDRAASKWKPPPKAVYPPELVAKVRELYECGLTITETAALGNGVVPQQAEAALRRLLNDDDWEVPAYG
jgi:hypothetical protein